MGVSTAVGILAGREYRPKWLPNNCKCLLNSSALLNAVENWIQQRTRTTEKEMKMKHPNNINYLLHQSRIWLPFTISLGDIAKEGSADALSKHKNYKKLQVGKISEMPSFISLLSVGFVSWVRFCFTVSPDSSLFSAALSPSGIVCWNHRRPRLRGRVIQHEARS